MTKFLRRILALFVEGLTVIVGLLIMILCLIGIVAIVGFRWRPFRRTSVVR